MAFKSLKRMLGGRGAEPPAPAKARPTMPVGPSDLANLVGVMTRLLTGLDSRLSREKLHLNNWVAMTFLSDARTLSNKQLAKLLGLPVPRVRAVIDDLRKSGLIRHAAPGADGIRNSFELTEAGVESLTKANAELAPQLAGVLKGRERAFENVNKQLRLLMRIVR